MIRLRIFGTGCSRQQKMQEKIRQAAAATGVDIELVVVQDIDELIRHRISRTPALEVNGVVVINGRVPFRAELEEIFTRANKSLTDSESGPVMKHSQTAEPRHSPNDLNPINLVVENSSAMKNPITWIVGLDFTPMDRAVIEYTASMAEILVPDKIYFLHVYPNLDLPEVARAALSQPEIPLDERLSAEMQKTIADEFPDFARYQAEAMVVEGKPESQILRWAHIKSAELLIMGRKKKMGGSGVIPKRVARKAECSVLFVPERPNFQLRTFLVPTDFSTPSGRAIETADWIASHIEGSEVFLYHACHLPSSIYYDGLAGSNMVDLLQEAAEEQMQEFKDRYNSPDSRVLVNAKADRSVAKTIAESADDVSADMVVIGGKGRSGLTGVLIGSVTESLLQAMDDVPVWVVKLEHKRQSGADQANKTAQSRA